ncbi:bifunctional 3-phenylpropionate/cinnamic acid dioxygenase ferredoxin subunit [Pseudomonas veronii]|uniref:bifunctional 3-phenylpropionate/cinnamic acid dioxygenase ferredoxin subunit n=1 Tax=Pseudomonas veronii TaxID=76761 RepID=UPI002D76DFAD|nr:bifunctional 3-phenylpropionate/cinnamic acid dioxygenase ferredoxin subunit [Pseudomonas veronii]WRU61171.1 bifunctional 3-phenylpropionate/cinnamic acid dioxygenase ferredoxin subunit [Pseudomonas veronii]
MSWIQIATVDILADDEVKAFDLSGAHIALYRCEGEFYATDNICTHQYALLSEGYLEDGCIECPLHQATFNVRTGEAKCAPATEPLKTYPVKVEGDAVFVNLG